MIPKQLPLVCTSVSALWSVYAYVSNDIALLGPMLVLAGIGIFLAMWQIWRTEDSSIKVWNMVALIFALAPLTILHLAAGFALG